MRPWGFRWSCHYELRNMVLFHNRITHCPSLAQHPIPSSSFTRHPFRLHALFTSSFLSLKPGPSQVADREKHDTVAARSTIAAEIPTGLHVACRWRSLIYLLSCRWWNIPCFTKCSYPVSPTKPPFQLLQYTASLLFIMCLHFLQQRLWVYLFTQSGHELHSGILYATYAALFPSRPTIT